MGLEVADSARVHTNHYLEILWFKYWLVSLVLFPVSFAFVFQAVAVTFWGLAVIQISLESKSIQAGA